MAGTNDTVYKIILIGDVGVGKTFMVRRFIDQKLPSESNVPTIGLAFSAKTIELKNGAKIRAQIWDTAGQEKYRSICSGHYHDASGCILVYDITRENTFFNCTQWLSDFRMQAPIDAKVILVGNKLDITEKNPKLRKVNVETGRNFAKTNNLEFKETSAVTDENVDDAFQSLLQECFLERNAQNPTEFEGFKQSEKPYKVSDKNKDDDGLSNCLGKCGL